MVKWEYKIVTIDDYTKTNEENEEILNGLGKEGWELVAIIRYTDAEEFAYLKRRKN